MKLRIILVIFALFTRCKSTEQLQIYNPFLDRELVLEKKAYPVQILLKHTP